MKSLKDIPVLILNASYEPIHIASARRALALLIKGIAAREEEHDREVVPGFRVPSVVRLVEYRRVPHHRVKPDHRHIYLRDGYCCQYCGKQFSYKELTLDHIIPKAQGGPSTWENLVAACQPCNHTKADRTPEQAGMKLLHKPRPMSMHTSRHMLRMIGSTEPKWHQYLYY